MELKTYAPVGLKFVFKKIKFNPILFGVSGVPLFNWVGAKMPYPCIF